MSQNRVEGNPQADRERRLLLELPRICLSSRELCDFELIAVDALPFSGLMTEEEYKIVINQMRLPNGDIFPVPILLSVNENTANQAINNGSLILTDKEGIPCGILDVFSIWEPNKKEEAELVFGITDPNHPGVAYLYDSPPYYVGGPIRFISLPSHYRFQDLRLTPEQVIEWKKENNLDALGAFQTRNLIYRAYFKATLHALPQVANKYPITREGRETNTLRIGLVVAEIERRSGIAIISLMAPYRNPRDIIRKITFDIGSSFIDTRFYSD
jgi:ATP sulfurylase